MSKTPHKSGNSPVRLNGKCFKKEKGLIPREAFLYKLIIIDNINLCYLII